MQAFRFHHEVLGAADPRLPAALAAAHAAKLRPLCVCQEAGVPMYVARSGDRYLVKRMPNSGSQHQLDCDSYEPPAELSGLGEVAGSAIQEDIESGVTALKLDFSLSKTGGRKAPVASGLEPESVRTDGAKLTLRGTLHYLWDEAGLSRWSPAMAGKRSWFIVRKHLLQAAENKTTKGAALGSLLFVPETFSVDHKDELLQRRTARLAPLSAPTHGARKLMVLVGEVKLIEPSRYGHKLVIKHLPDLPFMVAEDLHKRMLKRFGNDLALWDAEGSTHLLAIATFGMGSTGIASIEELALVLTSATWIPVEHRHDLELVDALTHAGRRFTKGLAALQHGGRSTAGVGGAVRHGATPGRALHRSAERDGRLRNRARCAHRRERPGAVDLESGRAGVSFIAGVYRLRAGAAIELARLCCEHPSLRARPRARRTLIRTLT